MPGGQFLELLLLKWSDFDNSKIAAGYFTHNYGLDHFTAVHIKTIDVSHRIFPVPLIPKIIFRIFYSAFVFFWRTKYYKTFQAILTLKPISAYN